MSGNDTRPMGILHRSATVIELLAERGPLTVAQVAEEVGMPRPSVYRLTDALAQASLVETTADGKLRASLRWLRLADSARLAMSEWSNARSTLDDLAHETGQTVYLSVPQGDRAMCIDWTRGRGINVLSLRPGRTLPLYAGAAGRVTLAFRRDNPEAYLAQAPFTPLSAHTLTQAAELRSDIATIQEVGYCMSDEDVTPGIGALGVPLNNAGGAFVGALSLAGLVGEVRARREELTTALLLSSQRLT